MNLGLEIAADCSTEFIKPVPKQSNNKINNDVQIEYQIQSH